MTDSLPTPGWVSAQPLRIRVSQFVDALEQAVHDASHEASGNAQLVHFWDWASLNFPVRGRLEIARRTEAQQPFRREELVEALYGAGFLGPVSMLQSHRTEFVSALATWRVAAGRERYPTGPNYEAKVLRKITKLVEASDELSVASIQKSLALLARADYRDFIKVQAASGTWQTRLGRLLDDELLDLEDHGDSLEILADDPLFEEFAHRIRSFAGRYATNVSIAMDAAALTALARMNREAPAHEHKVYPRFFTSSATLARTYKSDDWVREQLRFPVGTGTVWRTSEYYLLRALFPALRIGASATAESDDELGSLARLEFWAIRLREALGKAPSEELSKLVSEMVVVEKGRRSLADVVNDLAENRLTNIWLSYEPYNVPEAFGHMLEGLQRLREDDRVQMQAELLEQRIEKSLSDGLRGVHVASQLARAVEVGLRQYALRAGKTSVSLKHDLGSARWGLEYDGKLDTITFDRDDSDTGYAGLIKTFDLRRLRADPEKTLRLAAILLGLEYFEVTADLLDLSEHESATPRHRLLAHISALGANSSPPEQALAFRMRVIRDEYKALPADLASSLALGYAHAVFLAWQRSVYGGAVGLLESPRDDLGWGALSIEIVERARPTLSPLAQTHADNHFFYVSASLGSAVDVSSNRFRHFASAALAQNNFHFLDTAGFVHYQRARGMQADGDTAVAVMEELDLARDFTTLARRLFPSDSEIKTHEDRIKSLRAVVLGSD